jgi:hypothetical protein
LLTHGAGSDRNHPTLLALALALSPAPVDRIDFPYRAAGRKGPPDRAPKLVAAIEEAHGALIRREGVPPDSVLLGGRSMGGRMCSMAVADGLPASGLVLLSYPLHPVGKPEKLRVEHFPDVTVPTLFVSGDRDPMGPIDDLRAHAAAIRGPVTFHVLDGARHDPKNADPEIAEAVLAWIAGLA